MNILTKFNSSSSTNKGAMIGLSTPPDGAKASENEMFVFELVRRHLITKETMLINVEWKYSQSMNMTLHFGNYTIPGFNRTGDRNGSEEFYEDLD